jgi:hypothetical protein
MSRRVIKPNVENGYSKNMLMLDNGEIVYHGLNNWHDNKIYCRFCGIWAKYALVDIFCIRTKNGTDISSGSMCIRSKICAERCKEDTEKYRRNFAFEQMLLNTADRWPLLAFAVACHKKISVSSSKFACILAEHTRHISSFLSTNRDNSEYIYNCEQVDRDAEKYRKRCKYLMQKRVNRDNRLPTLIFTTACHKAALAPKILPTEILPTNKINLLVRVMNAKAFYGSHKMIIASFLSEEQ